MGRGGALSPSGAGAPRIALVTCRQLPEPDPDEELLLAALHAAGLAAELVAWDYEEVDPGAFDLCILRSCWNYFRDPEAFLAFVDRAAGASRLWNPGEVVRWNLHKRYLEELEAAGVPIVPTAWFERGRPADLGALLAERSWSEVVIKPAVSAASYRTERFAGDESERAQEFLDRLLKERDAMIQPYMPAVESPGERAVIWIDGEITHAVGKEPRFADQSERVSEAQRVEPREREVAERALGCVRGELLYARIDLVADGERGPVVSELELIEPSLYLLQEPAALERLVAAIERRANG